VTCQIFDRQWQRSFKGYKHHPTIIVDWPEKILSAKGGGVGNMEMEMATIAVTMTINDNKFIN